MKWRELAVACLLIAMAAMFSWIGIAAKAPTIDEPLHIAGGIATWELRDYRLVPETGLVPQAVSGLPFLMDGSQVEVDTTTKAWEYGSKWEVAEDWLYGSEEAVNHNTRSGRLAMLLFNVFGLLVVFLVSTSLWGTTGGFLSLVLAAFSPNFLGHMPLTTSDFTTSWMIVLTVYAYANLASRITLLKVIATGGILGIALLSKHSAIILIPIALLILLVRLLQKRTLAIRVFKKDFAAQNPLPQLGGMIAAGAATLLVALVVIWGFHSFRYEAANPEAGEFARFMLGWDSIRETGGIRSQLIGYLAQFRIFPEAWLYGLDFIFDQSDRSNFLHGEYRGSGGFLMYFPYCFLYKTPPAAILIHLFGALAFIAVIIKTKGEISLVATGLAGALLIYGPLLLFSDMNIGYRHAFPVLLVSCIAAGSLFSRQLRISKPAHAAIIVLALSMIPSAWAQRDRYISYINLIGGGEQGGYERLRDSSLDWGQDMHLAISRIKKETYPHPEKPVLFSYFGAVRPEMYGAPVTHYLPSVWHERKSNFLPKLMPGLYVISASMAFSGNEGSEAFFEAQYMHLQKRAEPIYGQLVDGNALTERAARKLLDPPAIQALRSYEWARFIRLNRFLAKRGPDEVINGTILVFDLSARDIENFYK